MRHPDRKPLSALFERPAAELNADGWQRIELPAGEWLWRHGAAAGTLAWIESGRLRVEVDGTAKSEIGARELLGEASMFTPGERRTADVKALESVSLWLLSRPGLQALEERNAELYDTILEAALVALAQRVRDAEAALTPPAQRPDLAEQAPYPRHGAAPAARRPPALAEALPVLPVVAASELASAELSDVAEPVFVEAGHALCLEGDAADALYLVGSGQIRVMLGQTEVGSVGPGSLLGTSAMLENATRSAALVAGEPAWVHSLALDRLAQLSPPTWRALVLSLLAIMRGQLVAAHRASIRSRTASGVFSFEKAMPALRSLQGWDAQHSVEVTPDALPPVGDARQLDSDVTRRIELIRHARLGRDIALTTPFGAKRIVDAAPSDSGCPLGFIEDFLREQVLPSLEPPKAHLGPKGHQTAAFLRQAGERIRESVSAPQDAEVRFTRSPAHAALAELLAAKAATEAPVVLVCDHTREALTAPLRQLGAQLEVVPTDSSGAIDAAALAVALGRHAAAPLRVGCFPAISPVTGIAAATESLSRLLHDNGALAFWDYSAAGPNAGLRFCGDLIFIASGELPGATAAANALVIGATRDRVATSPELDAGGAVAAIRAGLAFQLRDQVGAEVISAVGHDDVARAITAWGANPSVRFVGPPQSARATAVALTITHRGRFLHPGLVVALLGDLFGVQARARQADAGGALFGLGPESEKILAARVAEGWGALAPSWTRIELSHLLSEQELRYVVSAVQLIAVYGWALGPRYDCDPKTGRWSHRAGATHRNAELAELRIESGRPRWGKAWPERPESVLEAQLEEGRGLLEAALHQVPVEPWAPELPEELHEARWFPLPHELAADLRDRKRTVDHGAKERLAAYRHALRESKPEAAEQLRHALRLSPEEQGEALEAEA